MIGARAPVVAVAAVGLLVWPGPASSEAVGGEPLPAAFRPLVERLTRDGFDRELLKRLYADPRTTYLGRAVAFNLKRIERPADYDQFLSEASVRQGVAFLHRHRSLLEAVAGRSGVSPDVLVAILFVESRFGRHKGRHRVFNVYSSLAVAEEPHHLEAALRRLRARYPGTARAQVRRRARKKAQWAYGELKALLRVAAEQGFDVHELRGSWAGAFGLPQFIPSSYRTYAVDGNDDGLVDLDILPDAAASIGAYLQRHGWQPSLSRRQKTQVLLTYNNSRLYASTILAYAERLRERP
ncbi:MAG: lytic murein transglycosylase [Nitrospinota bacterium]